jgi:phage terminase large subunit-like protein
MEIKRASTKKPDFCDEKKPIVMKKKKSSCNTCSSEGSTVDSKEIVRIIEEEIGKHNFSIKGD